ncbi:MAG TPA: peptidoglycan DD-metalloendopeptidase family protein [Gaiella sp.]|nr:peptidoglycan DD-metalloendopeptidase family protein [Gaiella sp.]
MHRFLVLGAVLAAALVHGAAARAWSWPTDGPVLRPFELGPDGYAAGQHRGLDVGGDAGSPVRGPAAGTVTFAGVVPTHGRGVTILTADGYAVTLFHLESIAVARGDAVGEGAVIGTLGSSGEPEHGVPALHLGIRRADQPEGYVDPVGLLPARPAAPAAQPPVAAVPAPAVVPTPVPPPVAPPPATAAPPPPTAPGAPPAAPQPSAAGATTQVEQRATPTASPGGSGVPQGVTVAAPPGPTETADGAADGAHRDVARGPGGVAVGRAVEGSTTVVRARPEPASRPAVSRPRPARPFPPIARAVPQAPTVGPSRGGPTTLAHRGAVERAARRHRPEAAPTRSTPPAETAVRVDAARAVGLGRLERPGTLASPLVVDGPGTGIGLAELIAAAVLVALAAARAGLELARRIDRNGAVLPDNPDLLRQLDAAHRPRVHDGRGGRVRAPSAAARP